MYIICILFNEQNEIQNFINAKTLMLSFCTSTREHTSVAVNKAQNDPQGTPNPVVLDLSC